MTFASALPAFVTLTVLVLAVDVLAGLAVRVPRARPGQDLALLDHLRELRTRLLSIFLGAAALAFLFFGFGLRQVGPTWLWIPWPSVAESVAAVTFRGLADRFVPEGVTVVVVSPLDGVVSLLVVALVLTAAATLPLVLFHAGAFLGPALAPRERKAAVAALPLAIGLFLAGVAFGWWLVVPSILATLYGYAAALGALPLASVSSLVTFAAVILLVLGLAFELPVAMAALTRVRLVEARTWWSGWRHAVLAIVVVAAVVTPDPTIVSQAFVAAPMLALYFLGAAISSAVSPKAPAGTTQG